MVEVMEMVDVAEMVEVAEEERAAQTEAERRRPRPGDVGIIVAVRRISRGDRGRTAPERGSADHEQHQGGNWPYQDHFPVRWFWRRWRLRMRFGRDLLCLIQSEKLHRTILDTWWRGVILGLRSSRSLVMGQHRNSVAGMEKVAATYDRLARGWLPVG